MEKLLPPPLTDESKPWGVIKFKCTHGKYADGEIHEFYSCVNEMTGDRLSAIDTDGPEINDTIKWVKSVFRDIRARETIVGFGGSKEFENS